MLLEPVVGTAGCLLDVNSWLALVFVTVEPAGIIAVWIRWESADDGVGITARRRCDEGDSVSMVVLSRSPPGKVCLRGVNCRSLIDRRSSPFGVLDPSGQCTWDFFNELARDKDRGVVFSDTKIRWSWLDSTYGPLYELISQAESNSINIDSNRRNFTVETPSVWFSPSCVAVGFPSVLRKDFWLS